MLSNIPEESTNTNFSQSKAKTSASKKAEGAGMEINQDRVSSVQDQAEKSARIKVERTPIQEEGKSRSKLRSLKEESLKDEKEKKEKYKLPKSRDKSEECKKSDKDSREKGKSSRSKEKDEKFLGRKRHSPGRKKHDRDFEKNNENFYKSNMKGSDRRKFTNQKRPNHSTDMSFDSSKFCMWMCPKNSCKSTNFINRVDCYKCKEPKPQRPSLVNRSPPRDTKRNSSVFANANSHFKSQKEPRSKNSFPEFTPLHLEDMSLRKGSPAKSYYGGERNFKNNNIKLEPKITSLTGSEDSFKQYSIIPKSEPIFSEFPYPEIRKAINFLKKFKQEDMEGYQKFRHSTYK